MGYSRHHGGGKKCVKKLGETVTVLDNIVRHDWLYGDGGGEFD